MSDYGFKLLPDSKDPTPDRVEAAKNALARDMEANGLSIYAFNGKGSWNNGIHYDSDPAVFIGGDCCPRDFVQLKNWDEVNAFLGKVKEAAETLFGKV